MNNTIYGYRSFTKTDGHHGNPTQIIEDLSKEILLTKRQKLAKLSGCSEIVFIDDFQNPYISIYTPQSQIPFAGHAVLAAAHYFLSLKKAPISQIISLNHPITIWQENDMFWTQTSTAALPPWQFSQYDSPEQIDAIQLTETTNWPHTLAWAWVDSRQGTVRARTFAADWDIPEDEANGSGAMLLSRQLNRPLTIHHGQGSVVFARPVDENNSALGGKVMLDS